MSLPKTIAALLAISVLAVTTRMLLKEKSIIALQNSFDLREFKDCPQCPDMVVLPSGDYMMGSKDDYKHTTSSSLPTRKVTIDYHLAVEKTEVLRSDWYQCYLDGHCDPYKPKKDGSGNIL